MPPKVQAVKKQAPKPQAVKKPLPKTTPPAVKKQAANPLPAKKKPLPTPRPQAAKKQPPQQQSWLTRYTNTVASGVGNFGSAIVGAVGNGVAGAGKGAGSSITNTSRGWGDSIRDYGNSIKDVTGASGARGSTNKNPLGLASTPSGARAVMASRPGPTPRKGTAGNPLGL